MAQNQSEGNGSDDVGDNGAVTGNENAGGNIESTGSETGGLRTINPADGEIKRGRGRPRNADKPGAAKSATTATKSGKTPQNAIGIDTVLFSLHQMAATFIVPELAIDENEAKQLAAGVAAVNAHYGKTIDPKITAWIGLLAVCGKVYGPRIGAFTLRRSIERNASPKVNPLSGKNPQPPRSQTVTQEIKNIFNDPANVSLPVSEG